jgi:peptide alpha-N-acetyltransferase
MAVRFMSLELDLMFNDIILETICMKGLILTHMGKREEGLELVKRGVRLDLTSHICWHVFGLIQKAEKNYEEALKSYTQALRFDKVRVL